MLISPCFPSHQAPSLSFSSFFFESCPAFSSFSLFRSYSLFRRVILLLVAKKSGFFFILSNDCMHAAAAEEEIFFHHGGNLSLWLFFAFTAGVLCISFAKKGTNSHFTRHLHTDIQLTLKIHGSFTKNSVFSRDISFFP